MQQCIFVYFIRLDSGSDGESLPGVAGAGQSNMSTEVAALIQDANSYRPGKNGFSKQKNRTGSGPANTLKYINIVNGPGRYIDTIKQTQWPQQFKNKTGPEN